MKEISIVRENLMTRKGYTPYCGNDNPNYLLSGCNNPRTVFNGKQFICPQCSWISQYPEDFIDRYKKHWEFNSLK